MACRLPIILQTKPSFITSLIRCCKRNQSNLNINLVDLTPPIKNNVPMLFVPGRYSNEVYQIVKPIIDLDYIFQNINKIRDNCQKRKIELNFNDSLPLIEKWKKLKDDHQSLVAKEKEYLEKIIHLTSLKISDPTINEAHEHYLGRIKAVRDEIYDIEDDIMPFFQKLPNDLDKKTPIDENTYDIYFRPTSFNFPVLSHKTIGINLSYLKFSEISPTSYFLYGKLAEMDFALYCYLGDYFKNREFAPLSCVDFCKSFLIEATGHDPNSYDECIPLKTKEKVMGQKLNLVGGASLESYCAYLTNMNVNVLTFPLKYYSLGRKYNAEYRTNASPNLFSVVQSNNIHYLVLCEPSEISKEFNQVFEILLDCFKILKLPFRIVDNAAPYLLTTESRRLDIELWSPFEKSYIKCAYLSNHLDFLSKRLHITYGIEHIVEGYCGIIEGAINIPVILGCLIENFQNSKGDFDVPDFIKNYEL